MKALSVNQGQSAALSAGRTKTHVPFAGEKPPVDLLKVLSGSPDQAGEVLRLDSRTLRSHLTEKFLRGLGNRPRVHGNGFVQLDITPRARLHVWGHRQIPKAKVETPIHDHIFGFRSWGLAGLLRNIIYDLDPTRDDFEMYKPRIREGEDTVLAPTGIKVGVKTRKLDVIVPKDDTGRGERLPDSYDMHPWDFHETQVEGSTATLILKDGDTLAQRPDGIQPTVLVPKGVKPDPEFSRYTAEPEQLWQIIREVLRLPS
jgi:hypothetical protein